MTENKKENEAEEIKEELNEEVIADEMITIEKSEIEKRDAKIKELEDKNLRSLAELENTRKRLQKEKIEMQIYARESLACEFLTPIDQFGSALGFKDQQSDEVKNWMIGFEMILAQFNDVLSQNEIFPIEAKGKKFDPFFHEAMEMQETDQYPENTVIHEFVKGYKMGDKIIRPAKVKVAKAISSESKETQETKKTTETINQKEG